MGKASRRKASTRAQGIPNSAGKVGPTVGGLEAIIVRSDLPQEEKISHALLQLLEGEVADDAPLEKFQAALHFIIIAWNLSLMGTDKRLAALQALAADIEGAGNGERRAMLADVERLIARKLALFPDDKRHVVCGEVLLQGDKLHITAAALTPPTLRFTSTKS